MPPTCCLRRVDLAFAESQQAQKLPLEDGQSTALLAAATDKPFLPK